MRRGGNLCAFLPLRPGGRGCPGDPRCILLIAASKHSPSPPPPPLLFLLERQQRPPTIPSMLPRPYSVLGSGSGALLLLRTPEGPWVDPQAASMSKVPQSQQAV